MSKHIPQDLTEALVMLIEELSPKDLDAIKESTSGGFLHFGLGMQIRNRWGLWHNSCLAKWFGKQGIWHADDMSGIILESLRRVLNGKQIDLESQVKFYLDYWGKHPQKVLTRKSTYVINNSCANA